MYRKSRLAMAVAIASTGSMPALAQSDQSADRIEEVVVTGSRIKRQDYVANSPISTVSAEQLKITSATTLDKYLNTLPQVNPAGGSTSNNPGNNGQSNVDLRGLGSNRNLVLIDGRRAMPSASDMTVDLNTIPAALIESMEVITGGAGAVYGADAVAGAVNIKLKKDFEGFDFRYSHSDSEQHNDAKDYQLSAVWGGNFADDRGNAVIALDHAWREGMIKNQRDFSANATSTTSFLPEGLLQGSSGNQIPQSAIDTLFARADYGGHAPGSTNATLLGLNTDGSLFSRGVFNSPLDVLNWRYPIDGNINSNLFPDLYSYNFDFVNILTLPLERDSVMAKMNYKFDNSIEAFTQFGYTEYKSVTALAPTPWPTITTQSPTGNNPNRATSALIENGKSVANAAIIPVTNPFIPADLAYLLSQRTGDNTSLVGSGATEPFLMRTRLLDGGLRESIYENKVVQFMAGARGDLPDLPFGSDWSWEGYLMEGRTYIDESQTGNIDTNKALGLLAAADGGASVCSGGLNIFGRNPVSAECVDYLQLSNTVSTEFQQQIAQGFVSGNLFEMPAGPLAVVLGYEIRMFEYELDPGSAAGPISGLNAQTPASGENSFKDWFAEVGIPIVRDAPFAAAVDLTLGYRLSSYEFEDSLNGVKGDEVDDSTYKAELSWKIDDTWRARASYQRAVRAPNFDELFDGGGSNPQYFDPCSVDSAARNGPNAAQVRQLCLDTGVAPGAIDSYIQTPGNQIGVTITGNTALDSEEADTYTLGLVFQSPWDGALANLQATIDWYRIKIKSPILDTSANILVADCYNYYGNNPSYDASMPACQSVLRFGGDIIWISPPADAFFPGSPAYYYPGVNAGVIDTSGFDFAVAYGVDLPVGHLDLSMLWTYVTEFKQSDGTGLPTIDYAGTVSYFGEPLGSSYPEWKGMMMASYSVSDFVFDLRANYIDGMENRAGKQFPGEKSFTGTDSILYWDLSGAYTWRDTFTIRLGVENLTDEEPETYAPNVQSGTDPSLYDVIGRRLFGQVQMKF